MDKLNLLVIGSGGREYAVARKLKQSPLVENVYFAPGNDAMDLIGVQSIPILENNFEKLKEFAIDNNIDWTFVGPEDALVEGIVDYFHKFNLKIFGPDKIAAQLEGSKEYALNFMKKYHVPHPKYESFEKVEKALAAVNDFGLPVVIKEDGLAGGKGVVIAPNLKIAQKAITNAFKHGNKVVLEENLTGSEYSFFVIIQDDKYRILPIAQDHKRAYDMDKGPNTGGMGAYSPVPQLKVSDKKQIIDELIKPTVNGLKKENYSYHGVLYFGIMLTKNGPKMIEYNVRLGDPETEVVLPRLQTDFAQLINACVNDDEMPQIEVYPFAEVGVVLAAQGYPKDPIKGQNLGAFPKQSGIEIDYANVKKQNGDFIGNGGRLLMVRSRSDTIAQAQKLVYHYLSGLNKPQTFYRYDIGYKVTKIRF